MLATETGEASNVETAVVSTVEEPNVETGQASAVEGSDVETGEVSTADARELSVEAVSVKAIEITECRPQEAEVSILSIINSFDQPLSNKKPYILSEI